MQQEQQELYNWDNINDIISYACKKFDLILEGYQQNSIIIMLYFYKYKKEFTNLKILYNLLSEYNAKILLRDKKILQVLDFVKSSNVMESNQ